MTTADWAFYYVALGLLTSPFWILGLLVGLYFFGLIGYALLWVVNTMLGAGEEDT